jgi:hypothetical protein
MNTSSWDGSSTNLSPEALYLLDLVVKEVEAGGPFEVPLSTIVERFRRSNPYEKGTSPDLRQLLALIQGQGYLNFHTSMAGQAFGFGDIAGLNHARQLLGQRPHGRTRKQVAPTRISELAQDVLANTVALYDRGNYEFTDEELTALCMQPSAATHDAILELMDAGLLELWSPKGEIHYWLPDIESARKAAKRILFKPLPRVRRSPLAERATV